jgi:hypothetical protein
MMTSSGIELHNKTAVCKWKAHNSSSATLNLSIPLITHPVTRYIQQNFEMAAATRKELLKKVYNMVPPMLESFHKGKS